MEGNLNLLHLVQLQWQTISIIKGHLYHLTNNAPRVGPDCPVSKGYWQKPYPLIHILPQSDIQICVSWAHNLVK